MGVFSIRGYANREVEYDIAKVSVKFFAVSLEVEKASKLVMEECEKFLNKIEEAGFSAKNFHIDEDNTSECYSYSRDTSGQYKAVRVLSIAMKFNMKAINKIRDIIICNNFNAGFDVSYSLSNDDEIMSELMNEAILNSKENAQRLAKTLGMSVVAIKESNIDFREELGAGDILGLPDELEELKYVKSAELSAPKTKLDRYVDVKWVLE